MPTDTKRRPSERVYVNSNGHQRTAAAPTRSQPRRNSGNDLPLKLSSSSDPHETNDMKRRSSERVYVERQQIAAARRTSSKPNTANFNGKFLDNLPESSAVLNFNRRPGNHVNNTVPQSSSLNQGDISGRSTQVMSGSFQCLFKDHSAQPSIQRAGHNSSFNRDTEILRRKRSQSHDDMTDAAIQQPRRQSEASSSLKGFPYEAEKPVSLSERLKMRRQTQVSASSQIEYMKMLKQKEQSLLAKPSNGINSFSPTISTYDSSTDTNNGRLMLGGAQMTPSKKVQSNRSMKDSNRLLVEFSDNPKEESQNGSLFCVHKKVVIIGLFLLLSGLGLGGYFYFFQRDELKDESGSKEASGITDHNITKNSSKVDIVISTPPSDIEARCSASNLPGSLSACLSACLPSACCYPSFTGETCFDNTGCSPYRPHCDIFYNSWSGATEGVLREVTNDIVDMCTATNANSSQEKLPMTHNNSHVPNGSTDDLSKFSTRKRLRGHHVQANVTDATIFSSTQQTCQQYCVGAKCCDAPVIGDPMLSGLVLSPFGVYTDSISGDYVMTNCQTSNSKNVHICARYRELCSFGEVVESGFEPVLNETESTYVTTTPLPAPSPVLVPASNQTTNAINFSVAVASNTTTIPTNSPSQSEGTSSTSQPTTFLTGRGTSSTLRPTSFLTRSPVSSLIINEPIILVPSAHSENIELSCASDKAKFLIRTGDTSARAQCIQACLEGLCCFTDDLGISLMNSCYEGNEHSCTQYASCLILKDNTLQKDEEVAESLESSSNLTASEETNTSIAKGNETTLVQNYETSPIQYNVSTYVASNSSNNTNATTDINLVGYNAT